ncbi:MAG: cysteine--tRNA ligase, partial [Planctomycetota bacterium]
MEIRFYNTLTNQVERFEPLNAPLVKMYSCGPTVYDFAHVGNFRSFLFADLLRRFLEATGLDVWHVMNITDVGHMTDDAAADGLGEDKMQLAARRLKEDKKSGKVEKGAVANPDDPYEVADYFSRAFLEDGRTLGLKVCREYPARVPKATRFIGEMQETISKLIDRQHAYVGSDGVVYYSVESFPAYGRLSGNTLEALRVGAGGRIDLEGQNAKKHPADFMLWKPDPKHIMKWDSPWGAGYPGWHIECSVMSMQVLQTDVLDIHTGGEDLIFPHHECEIAQSCGVTGKDLFAQFWMHARFLLVEGEKMSKRKGNFYTVRDILSGKATGSPVHPAVLRLELIKSHYRAHTNFTSKGLNDSANTVRRLTELGVRLR